MVLFVGRGSELDRLAAQYAAAAVSGDDFEAIARELYLSRGHAENLARDLYRMHGVSSRAELAGIYLGLRDPAGAALPLPEPGAGEPPPGQWPRRRAPGLGKAIPTNPVVGSQQPSRCRPLRRRDRAPSPEPRAANGNQGRRFSRFGAWVFPLSSADWPLYARSGRIPIDPACPARGQAGGRHRGPAWAGRRHRTARAGETGGGGPGVGPRSSGSWPGPEPQEPAIRRCSRIAVISAC